MASSAPRAASGRAAARLDGERSRERILDAAERLLSERGYSGTGIAAISRASGLPASSIYWFFESKKDLTLTVVERAATRFLDDFERPGDGESQDFRGFVDRALEQSGSQLPEFARLLVLLALERGESDPDLVERLRDVRERSRDHVAATIARSLRAGGAEDGVDEAARDVSFLAMSMAEGTLIGRQIEPGGIDPERLAADLEVAVLALARQRLAETSS